MERYAGRNHNFFTKAEVNSTDFSDCTISWGFLSTGFSLLNESEIDNEDVEYSFSGDQNDVHGDLRANKSSAGIVFDHRTECKIYLRKASYATGPITVRIEVWRQ